MITLDYKEAIAFGGLPCTSNECTSIEYLYACGVLPPNYPVPAVMQIDPLYKNYICRNLLKWLWQF
jgi:hypothetical protein